jgi:hypothetical protein
MYFVIKDTRQHGSLTGMSVPSFYKSHSADGEDDTPFVDILAGI